VPLEMAGCTRPWSCAICGYWFALPLMVVVVVLGEEDEDKNKIIQSRCSQQTR
jgi:hypothetical protein